MFTDGVSGKNNLDETVGVFIHKKVWLKNNLTHSGRRGNWEGPCPSRETGCGGQRPQVEAYNKYVREKRPCVRARKGIHRMVEIKLLCFR